MSYCSQQSVSRILIKATKATNELEALVSRIPAALVSFPGFLQELGRSAVEDSELLLSGEVVGGSVVGVGPLQ